MVSLNTSPFGPQYYYYFYDWKIKTADQFCISPRTEVFVDALVVSTNEIDNTESIQVYPVPSSGQLHIDLQLDPNFKTDLSIMDITGKQVYAKTVMDTTNKLDLSSLISGIYTIKLVHNNRVYVGRLIMQ